MRPPKSLDAPVVSSIPIGISKLERDGKKGFVEGFHELSLNLSEFPGDGGRAGTNPKPSPGDQSRRLSVRTRVIPQNKPKIRLSVCTRVIPQNKPQISGSKKFRSSAILSFFLPRLSVHTRVIPQNKPKIRTSQEGEAH
ncbi:hypothetical protein DUI87_33511 [Hirundo rustica rustica]|uniref:Uncharacterized protein n=1 Tax=Hirundo rustica rustica TaxID=333673 RepID=A0A3M0IMZ5_HIRRU|nr:hypothetical protein DUI87_33511 [Hirundo rustica rustica]